MESGRKKFIMGYDPLGWGGELSWNQEDEILSWHTTFWGEKGTFMESRSIFFSMGYGPLGWGGGHSWNQEEETFSWDTIL